MLAADLRLQRGLQFVDMAAVQLSRMGDRAAQGRVEPLVRRNLGQGHAIGDGRQQGVALPFDQRGLHQQRQEGARIDAQRGLDRRGGRLMVAKAAATSGQAHPQADVAGLQPHRLFEPGARALQVAAGRGRIGRRPQVRDRLQRG